MNPIGSRDEAWRYLHTLKKPHRSRWELQSLFNLGVLFVRSRRDPLGRNINHPAIDPFLAAIRTMLEAAAELPPELVFLGSHVGVGSAAPDEAKWLPRLDADYVRKLAERGSHFHFSEDNEREVFFTLQDFLAVAHSFIAWIEPTPGHAHGAANAADWRSRLAAYDERTAFAGELLAAEGFNPRGFENREQARVAVSAESGMRYFPMEDFVYRQGWLNKAPGPTELMAFAVLCELEPPSQNQAERANRFGCWRAARKVAAKVIENETSPKNRKPKRYLAY